MFNYEKNIWCNPKEEYDEIQMRLHENVGPIVDKSMKDSGQVIYPSNLKYTYNSRLNSLLVIRLEIKFWIQHSKCLRDLKLCISREYNLYSIMFVCLIWGPGTMVVLFSQCAVIPGACVF